ncbi:hypothetical protein PGTUg99_009657 [Puccinia graminis f. sp. tritici]|uniref:Uncharacterized protein n=1 Tax=Puccinia graminis f. sp. tritici TaxID=56615 RepID=A0A5B0P2H1_PUCGR|nr:hypothetical protein PGTUg99_009657 [Puccinia graminis f. sp. tritici]
MVIAGSTPYPKAPANPPRLPAKQPTSKKRTKAEKKRLRKAQQAVFCWYCEREFEDAKGVESSSFSQP